MDIMSTGNTLMNSIKQWFAENKLMLNEKKTDCVIFRTKNLNQNINAIVLDNHKMSCSDDVKFLRVHIDATLTCEVILIT